MALAIVGCDDNTDTLGGSLIKEGSFVVATDSFPVASNSVVVDSLLSKNTIAYLGNGFVHYGRRNDSVAQLGQPWLAC